MLIRISLIVAILGGIAIAVISFVSLQDKVNKVVVNRKEWHDKYTSENGLRIKADNDLRLTKATLTTTEGKLTAMTQERNDANAKAQEESKRATELADTLKRTQQDLSATQNKLAAWEALGIPIETARKTLGSLAQAIADKENVESENKILYDRSVRLQAKLDFVIEGQRPDEPEGLSGRVVAVDPKYDFVIINVGKNQGVLADGHLLVHRNGVLVATVVVTDSIEANKCIANVLPGWKKDDVLEGDQVVTLK